VLIEIRSDRFRQRAIKFRAGLNVVLGDDNATNSIGKSSLLMVLDFVLGGNSLVEHNKDIVIELGHHDYFSSFLFNGEVYRFSRGTDRPDLVYPCDAEFHAQDPMDIDEFRAFLKSSYGLSADDMSFRSMVGLYSRVWGKQNLDVHHPLNAVPNQPPRECVDNLIKTFGMYGSIAALASDLKRLETEESDLRKAFRSQIVPRVGKREYADNVFRIEEMESELSDIKQNLAAFALNIAAIANREMLELKTQKDKLLDTKLQLDSKLLRIRRSLAESRYVKSRHFESLKGFFPDVNTERLANIETFHSSLAKVLKIELQESEASLKAQLDRANAEIAAIDERLLQRLGALESPGLVVDRVFDISTKLRTAKQENGYFDKMQSLSADRRAKDEELSGRRDAALREIENTLNRTMREIVSSVFGEQRKSPRIELTESNYHYEVFEDTGTGTAYSSLIVLDLAVFSTTELPVLIHDSILFKNIENKAVANLLNVYLASEKQCFIAIDEVDKYGNASAAMLRSHAAVQLDDEHVLYIKDWRKR
jgi:uncharacterized protein YydD (DUF2326 family)